METPKEKFGRGVLVYWEAGKDREQGQDVWAVYERTDTGSFEVVQLIRTKNSTKPNKAYPEGRPAGVLKYPSTEDWGSTGWTVKSIEHAKRIIQDKGK